jgi:rare lipoprotein A (peptidoglycan hydrolase)
MHSDVYLEQLIAGESHLYTAAEVADVRAAAKQEGKVEGRAERRHRNHLVDAFAAAIVGALLVVAFVAGRASAAPRSAQTTERVDMSALSSAGPIGAPRSGMPAASADDASRVVAAPVASVGAPSSSPDVELGTAIESGVASWYDDGPNLYAAVPDWSFGDEPYQVRVCRSGRCVTVTVRDHCGCPGNRIIDLSPEAFARLAPLSVGLVVGTVEGSGPSVTLPATETEP